MTINLRIKKRLASFAFVLAISFLGFSQDDGARVVTASQDYNLINECFSYNIFAFLGALAAKKLHIKVAHIEACFG